MEKNYGIEDTKVFAKVGDIEVRKAKGIDTVVSMYGSGSSGCYTNGGRSTVLYGYYFGGYGYFFKRKTDALYAANYLNENGWDESGDFEMIIQEAMSKEFFKAQEDGLKPKYSQYELGKVYF